MAKYERVKGHSGFDHSVKTAISRKIIDEEFICDNTAVDTVLFLCGDNFTGSLNDLPELFFKKVRRSIANFDSLASVISSITSNIEKNKSKKLELLDLLKVDIINKLVHHKKSGENIFQSIERICKLSNESIQDLKGQIDGLIKIGNVVVDTKNGTTETMKQNNTPYQLIEKNSLSISTDGMICINMRTIGKGLTEGKIIQIKDAFFNFMIKYNSDYFYKNAYINKSKTYLTKELYKMLNLYIHLVGITPKNNTDCKNNVTLPINTSIITNYQDLDKECLLNDDDKLVKLLSTPGLLLGEEKSFIGGKRLKFSVVEDKVLIESNILNKSNIITEEHLNIHLFDLIDYLQSDLFNGDFNDLPDKLKVKLDNADNPIMLTKLIGLLEPRLFEYFKVNIINFYHRLYNLGELTSEHFSIIYKKFNISADQLIMYFEYKKS